MICPPSRCKLVIVDCCVQNNRFRASKIHFVAPIFRLHKTSLRCERHLDYTRNDPQSGLKVPRIAQNYAVQKKHSVRSDQCSRGVSWAGARGIEVPIRHRVLGQVVQEVVCKLLGGEEESLIVGPVVGLGKPSDAPGLAAGPTTGIRVALVGHALLDVAGLLVEVDNVTGAIVISDVGFDSCQGVGGGYFREL